MRRRYVWVKRTAFGTRRRAELRDYLAAQAASNGRSLSEEIEDRLETSRLADDAWGGPRARSAEQRYAAYVKKSAVPDFGELIDALDLQTEDKLETGNARDPDALSGPAF